MIAGAITLVSISSSDIVCSLDNNSICPEDASIVLVISVEPDSPAATAGLLPEDHLILVNDTKIDSFDAVGTHKNSAQVVLKVMRSGSELTMETTKASAGAALGIKMKPGVNSQGIIALCRGLKQSKVSSLR